LIPLNKHKNRNEKITKNGKRNRKIWHGNW